MQYEEVTQNSFRYIKHVYLNDGGLKIKSRSLKFYIICEIRNQKLHTVICFAICFLSLFVSS